MCHSIASFRLGVGIGGGSGCSRRAIVLGIFYCRVVLIIWGCMLVLQELNVLAVCAGPFLAIGVICTSFPLAEDLSHRYCLIGSFDPKQPTN